MKTLFLYHSGDEIAQEILIPWLGVISQLEGVIELADSARQRWRRAQVLAQTQGWRKTGTVLVERAYRALAETRADREWRDRVLGAWPRSYRHARSAVMMQRGIAEIDAQAMRAALRRQASEIVLLHGDGLLPQERDALRSAGTFQLQPAVNGDGVPAGCGAVLLRLPECGDDEVMAYLPVQAGLVPNGPRARFESAVLGNLDTIAACLRAHIAGEARALACTGRDGASASSVTIPAGRVPRCAPQRAREGSALLYHDVVNSDPDSSGFPGRCAGIYKLQAADFTAHIDALARAFPSGPIVIRPDTPPLVRAAFMLTFDDGGVSSLDIADCLETRGWRGHFFITVGKIGHRGFLTAAQIRELRERGHAIGTHSMTHPPIISALPTEEIALEWRNSVALLSDVIGEAVRLASVPGGYCSRRVIEGARDAGVRFLWTSDPVRRLRMHGEIQILGRYTLKEKTSASLATALADDRSYQQLRQWLRWNSLKMVKKASGRFYPLIRQQVLAHTEMRDGKV